jgi:hypothetical protein
MKAQLLLIILYCLSCSMYYDIPILFVLSSLSLVIFGYYCTFIRYCNICHMKYDSLQYNHCCVCMFNYIKHISDGESYVDYYDHCCDCKSYFEENTNHNCKIKLD